MSEAPKKKRRPRLRRAALFILVVALVFAGHQALFHPKTPLSPAWNPVLPFDLADPKTPLSTWKLERALVSQSACQDALATGAGFSVLPDLEHSEVCHIRPRVQLQAIGEAAVTPVETRCQTALRIAAWSTLGVQPAAESHLGSRVASIRHASSYNCRHMRTSNGTNGRMSTHATADAIDVTGFTLTDGRAIDLLKGWDDPVTGPFLKEVRDQACTWFGTVLGPDFNRLHADHFHLQNRGWGTCR